MNEPIFSMLTGKPCGTQDFVCSQEGEDLVWITINDTTTNCNNCENGASPAGTTCGESMPIAPYMFCSNLGDTCSNLFECT